MHPSFITPIALNSAIPTRLRKYHHHRFYDIHRPIYSVRLQLRATITETDQSNQPDKPDKPLTPDEQGVAIGSLRTTQTLFCSSEGDALSTLSTIDLLSYCTLKGLPLHSNPWDRAALLQQARSYQADERLARIASGTRWDSLTQPKKLRLLHSVCNAEGDATYTDPVSGYTVFSAFAHLRRGHCCGVNTKADGNFERTHRCRHCPYTNDGSIGSWTIQALKNRLHVIQYVRQNLNRNWQTLPVPQQPSFQSSASSTSTIVADITEAAPQANAPSQDLFTTIAGDRSNKARLRRKLVKRVLLDAPVSEDAACDVCNDERMITCARCNGWTAVFSPRIRTCTECNGEGMHPCMQCTPFRPPPTTSLYS